MKKEKDTQENKDQKELPKFRVTQNYEPYSTWSSLSPTDSRYGYSPSRPSDKDQLL
jgi:hypothetical protein